MHYPSNPNTLHLETRFKSIQELGKNKNLTAEQKQNLAMFKFGKQMVITNTDSTISDHLSAIRD